MSGATAFASRLVRLVVRVLPADARDRYLHEHQAELAVLSGALQVRYAIGVVLSAPLLRRALQRPAGASLDATVRAAMPLGCRIGFHHVWRTESTEDGQRYRRCRRCGRDHPGLGSVKGGLGVGVPFSNY